MSKESEKVHITVLESRSARFIRPGDPCLQLGYPMELEKALEIAGRYTEFLPQFEGSVFIEEEGIKATKKLQCKLCNDRSAKRQDFEYLVPKLSPKTR